MVQVFNDWLAVPNYSKNVAMAAEFLKFLGSAANQNRYNSDFGSFPPRKDAWTGYVASDAVMQKMGALMDKYGMGFADMRRVGQAARNAPEGDARLLHRPARPRHDAQKHADPVYPDTERRQAHSVER